MGRIGDEIIQQVRDRVDIVELVGRFVSLKRSGRSYKGLCPFHDEKTPSFNVNSDRQSFYCFGCQEGGSAFTFLMKVEGLSFPEAVRSLAADCGIEVPESGGGDRGRIEPLFQATEIAQERYRAALGEEGNPGLAYLRERGIDAETIQRFGIGFAPDAWDTLVRALRGRRVAAESGATAGLLKERSSGGHYDLLRGRVTFPIRDVRGRVLGFGGRALAPDQEPKYLNTPESPIFKKRDAFFGFPQALEPIRRSDRAIVVEGYFDLIALHRAGIDGVVATCGTSLTPEHASGLRRRTKNVVLLFDGDEAGQKAALRALEILLPEGLRVRAAVLPAGDDPDTFLAREGPDALRKLVDEAPAALDFAIRRAAAGGCATPWEKADAVALVAPLLALVQSSVERGEFCRRLALAIDAEPSHVDEAVRAQGRGGDPREAVPVAPRQSTPEDRNVLWMARSIIEHPDVAGRVPRDELAVLVPVRALADLVATLVDAAASGPLDVTEVGERLDSDARRLLFALAADACDLDAAAAARTVDDTVRVLRRRRHRERQEQITRQMREPGADVPALLAEKRRLRDEYEKFTRPPMEPEPNPNR